MQEPQPIAPALCSGYGRNLVKCGRGQYDSRWYSGKQMRIFGYRNDHYLRFANIELGNGDRVHVRVTSHQVKVLKLYFGRLPLGVIWATTGPKEMGRLSYSAFGTNLLDAVIEYLRACNCAAEIKVKLPAFIGA